MILLLQLHCMTVVRAGSEDRGYQTFPCQCAGRTSPRPSEVGEVTLQDIDIIGAIGDSDSAAFAANSRGLDYFTEYWGFSFATGERLDRERSRSDCYSQGVTGAGRPTPVWPTC